MPNPLRRVLQRLSHPLPLVLVAGATAAGVPADITAARALAEFDTYCRTGERVWGQPLCGPVVVVDRATRRAVANRQPPAQGFERQGDAWVGTLPEGIGIANTSVDWGGTRWAEVVLPLPADAAERRVLLAHEAFHRIQPDLGADPVEADNAHLDSEHGRVMARLEAAALRAAVSAAHAGNDWQAPARDALAYRAARLSASPRAAAAEAALLANEGLAEYTGIRVGASDAQARLALDRLDSVRNRPSLVRSFGYVVGPAYGLLLDQDGDEWRTAALQGQALPDLLRARLGGPALPDADIAAHGGQRIVAEEAARAESIRARISAYTAALVDGPTVTFPFEAMQIEFDPNTLFALGQEGTVYAGSTTLRDGWGELRATGAVLIGPDWGFARVPGPAKSEGDTLSGPGWTATLADGFGLAAGDRPDAQRVGPVNRPRVR